MSLRLNPTRLVNALHFVEKTTGRAVQDSLNRAGKHTIIGSKGHKGAMQLTPVASKAAINRVPDRKIAGYVINKAKRTGAWPLTSAQIRAAVKKERKRRRSSTGYAAFAGWSNAAKAMGGRGVKGVTSDFNKSEARRGYGKRATSKANLRVVLTNTAPAAERIGLKALQGGLDNAAKDLEEYAMKKIQQGFNKVKP